MRTINGPETKTPGICLLKFILQTGHVVPFPYQLPTTSHALRTQQNGTFLHSPFTITEIASSPAAHSNDNKLVGWRELCVIMTFFLRINYRF
jgi:hypothetical protein